MADRPTVLNPELVSALKRLRSVASPRRLP
jgi:hypothetical protein